MKLPNMKDKQTALKTLLFAALAANVMWQPALKSLDLASTEALSAQPAAANTAATAVKPNVPSTAVTVSDVGPKPDAPAKPTAPMPTATTPVTEPVAEPILSDKSVREEIIKVCGQRFYVSYREINLETETLTEAVIKPHTGTVSMQPITYRFNGGYAMNLDNAEIKKDNDQALAALVQQRIGACADDAAPPVEKPELSAEEIAKIKEGVKACRLNKKGDPLTELEATHCKLEQLSEIGIDDESDHAGTKAMKAIERMVRGDLRKAIKNRLMSANEDKVAEGEDLLDETLDRLEDLSYDLDLDPRKYNKLVGELQALRTGGETFRRAAEMDSEVKDIKADLQEQLISAQAEAKANPNDPYAQQRVLDLQREILQTQAMLQNQMQMEITNGIYAQLTGEQRMGMMSASDFGQFTMPYQNLRSDLLSMLDVKSMFNINTSLDTGSTTGLPSDFASYRSGLANDFKRNYGVAVPDRSSMTSLGNTVGLAPTSSSTTSSQLNNAGIFSSSNFNPFSAPAAPTSTMGGRRWQ